MMTMLTAVSAMTASVVRLTLARRKSRIGQSAGSSGLRRRLRSDLHIPSGMNSSPRTNTAGRATKTTRPAYGLCSNNPATAAMVNAMKTTADAVAITTPTIASGWRASAQRLVTTSPRPPLLQALHVGHHRVDVCGGQGGVLGRHRRFLRGLRLGRRVLWMRDPLLDVVGAQLAADAVERARLAAFAGDRVAHLTLLRGVDLLPFLDQRSVLPRRRGHRTTQREYDREHRSHRTSFIDLVRSVRLQPDFVSGFSRTSSTVRLK